MRWLVVLALLCLAPTTALAADYRVTSCDCGKLVLVEADTIIRDGQGGVTASFISFDSAGADGFAPMNHTRARFDCTKGVMTRQTERTLTRPSDQGFAALAQPGTPGSFGPEIVQPGHPPEAAMAAVCPGQVPSRLGLVQGSSLAEAYDYQGHVFQGAKSTLPAQRLRVWAEAYRQAEVFPPVREKPFGQWALETILRLGLIMGFCFGFAALVRRFGQLPRNEVRYPLAAAALGPVSGVIGLGVLIYGWIDPQVSRNLILGFAAFFGLLSVVMSPYLLWWRVVMDDRGFTFTDYWRKRRRYAWSEVVHVFENSNADLVFILRDGRRLSLALGAHNIERFIDHTVEAGTTALF